MLGEALRLIRVFHDCKLGELAAGIDMSSSDISEIERSKKKPSIGTLEKYADFFETSVSAIMFFAENIDGNDHPSKSLIRRKLVRFLQIIENETA